MTPQGINKIMRGMPFIEESPQKAPSGAFLRVSRRELDYVTGGLDKSVEEAFLCVSRLLADILNKQVDRKRWVTLFGASGCGKTHLARKAVEFLHSHGWSHKGAQFWTWRNAFERIMQDEGCMAWLIKRPVLVLDDVGASYTASDKAAQLQAAKLLELLEARLGKWTILTTNLSPGDIASRLDSRIASRLKRGGSEVVDMRNAADYCWLMDERARSHR